MFTTLGLVLFGFAGFSAAYTLFVLLFGDKGTFFSVTTSPAVVGTPITTFPFTAPAGGITIAATGIVDLALTTMGQLFLLGGSLAAMVLAVLAFLSPTTLLNKCCINKSCLPKECCPAPAAPTCATGCGI